VIIILTIFLRGILKVFLSDILLIDKTEVDGIMDHSKDESVLVQ
jgi:hypothetical protein